MTYIFQGGHRAHYRTSKFQRELGVTVTRTQQNIIQETDLFIGEYFCMFQPKANVYMVRNGIIVGGMMLPVYIYVHFFCLFPRKTSALSQAR
jgi:hypothetical protein